MTEHPTPSGFWIRWLLAAALGVMVFGLVLVLAPGAARQGFALLLYGAPSGIDAFGAEPVRYVGLAHAVIGGVMVGWGAALFLAVRNWLARGDRAAWQLVALSLAAWYVPDTVYSLRSGYTPNALLNTGFLLLFALPLWGTRAVLRRGASARPGAARHAGS